MQAYDYAQPGAYFITICTEYRVCRFGTVHDGEMVVNEIGQRVTTSWSGLEERFGVGVDALVVMPNHLHGVLVFGGTDQGGHDVGKSIRIGASIYRDGSQVQTEGGHDGGGHGGAGPYGDGSPARQQHGAEALTLSEVVRRFKTYTANQARAILEQEHPLARIKLWQRNFHEHVIRNERELHAIREYIANNPLHWHLDQENPDRWDGRL